LPSIEKERGREIWLEVDNLSTHANARTLAGDRERESKRELAGISDLSLYPARGRGQAWALAGSGRKHRLPHQIWPETHVHWRGFDRLALHLPPFSPDPVVISILPSLSDPVGESLSLSRSLYDLSLSLSLSLGVSVVKRKRKEQRRRKDERKDEKKKGREKE